METFNIQMKLSLVGIGAVLRTDDGYPKIVEVVSGGPADKDGRLKANDRIVAVAQDKDDFEDVVDMKIDKVVEKIRGAKGTRVRLQVIPANVTDPSKRSMVEITRDEVKLKESEAKGEVIESKEVDGRNIKLGWLIVPSFYADMEGKAAKTVASTANGSDEGPKSTTKDVRRILGRMKQEGIEGLVIDLRRDGGGSLDEAIKLTGLFVGPGPVVQAKDSGGRVTVAADNAEEPFFSGPVVVLINRLSASASEIFAAALQDYGRAVVVGDQRSFGKGTVQTLLDVGKFLPVFSTQGGNAGTLKLTIQKFYRVSGGSTQHRGVLSDIVLPSPTDTDQIGESSLPNPLAYDEVNPLTVGKFTLAEAGGGNVAFRPAQGGNSQTAFNAFGPPLLDLLRQRSEERVVKDPEFRYIKEDMKILRKKLDANQLSLNEKVRKEEQAEEKHRKIARAAERKQNHVADPVAYQVTLDTVDKPELPCVTAKKPSATNSASTSDPDAVNEEDEPQGSSPDPIRREAVNILRDLTSLASDSIRTAHSAPPRNETGRN